MPPSPARPGLIDRHDLVAALDHAAEQKAPSISAPAGSGTTSLLRAWPTLDRGVEAEHLHVRQHALQR